MTPLSDSDAATPRSFDPSLPETLPRLLSSFEGLAGRLKETPADFIVEEVPSYLPSGEGGHLFVQVRKTDRDSLEVARILAGVADLSPRDVGVAGLKDRHAITTQWMSVPISQTTSAQELEQALRLGIEEVAGVELLDARPHQNKLRTGHLRANRFTIVLRGAEHLGESLDAALETLRTVGYPNYYGEQRFGRRGQNAARGLAKLRGQGKLRGRRDRLLVSAAQSAVFNLYAAQRLLDGALTTVQKGDILQRWPKGGPFRCEDPSTDQQRLTSGEVVITGPLPGTHVLSATERPGEWEQRAAETIGLGQRELEAAGKLARGSRRPLLTRPTTLEVERAEVGLVLRCELPSGCYATMLLRELLCP